MGIFLGGLDRCERVILEVVSRGFGGKGEGRRSVRCLIDVSHIRKQTRGDGMIVIHWVIARKRWARASSAEQSFFSLTVTRVGDY